MGVSVGELVDQIDCRRGSKQRQRVAARMPQAREVERLQFWRRLAEFVQVRQRHDEP